MSKKNNSISLKKYRNKREFNLGIFLFIIVFIYILITIFLYLTDDTISVYEVREGSIVKDNTYTGLVIRQETAVNAETDGYISYYQNENSKVKVGAYIYALSPEKLTTDDTVAQEDSNSSVSSDTLSGITLQLQNYSENYNSDQFSTVYTLKDEIISSLQNAYNTTRKEQLGAAIAASGQEVTSYATSADGIVAFTVDGYETLTKDTFTDENFDRSQYEITQFSDQMKVRSGQPVYRLITSDVWSVIVKLSRETAELLKEDEVSSVKVRIDKDSETMWGDLTVLAKDGSYYGCIDFDNSMIRYAQERYLNVELILEDESGLKIPKSSVIEEKFFVIPRDYLTESGDNTDVGVMAEDLKGNVSFQPVSIYDVSDDGTVCISRDSLSEGTVILKPDSSDTYTIGKTKSLQGVYNVNQGYTVFRKVSILCENDEYYIVQEGESYGLSNYDHIVQNGASVSENEVVFQ